LQLNPMSLVEIKGASKRKKRPLTLSFSQSAQILDLLAEPYRTMAVVALCTGLRVSEILALKWTDIDFDELSMHVTRAVVRGVVDDVKTEYSEDELPLDPDFATQLLNWKRQCPVSQDAWVFPSPVTARPYAPGTIQQKCFRVVGATVGLPNLGWHSFRHTYRSLLDATGAPVGVQQKLMRHAQVSTTMNVYGNAQMDSKRDANSRVVQGVLAPAV
ncbi:MAG: site-specific recombinase, phage integrase family, partial [Candidatus Angelobacter sp.]|nr:site-specific recombinase, phage integrase family [Candidatus Angelobacter sp.]